MNHKISSVMQPWAISDKFKEKYGKIWSEMDFELNKQISGQQFKRDPASVNVGTLKVCGKKILMNYKQLLSANNIVGEYADTVYFHRPKKDDRFAIEFGNNTLILKKHEVGRLAETLNDSADIIAKSYQLGYIYNK